MSLFLVLCLGLELAEALVISNPIAIAQQTRGLVLNVSLETEAEAQWNAEDFTPSSAQSMRLVCTIDEVSIRIDIGRQLFGTVTQHTFDVLSTLQWERIWV